jgi:zinc protease
MLNNGLEVVLKPNHFSQTVAIQLWVKVGSLDESEHNRGAAHFLEHMLFKGTNRRGVGEIAALVEECGGEINAYTTFDHTVIHLTLGSAYLSLGIDLLSDIFSNSQILEVEFAKEKEVIIEEILRSQDSPGAAVGRKVFALAFEGTEAARPIFGTLDSVKNLTKEEVTSFYKHWYVPSNAILVVVGALEVNSTLDLVRKTFGAIPPSPYVRRGRSDIDRSNQIGQNFSQVSIIKGDFQQSRVELVFGGPSLGHFDTVALDLAAFALGTGELSRLNRRVRDEQGLVQSIGASVYAPAFGGLFEVSAFVKEDQLLDAIEAILREVIKMRDIEPMTIEELSRARANINADRILRDETVDGEARSIGFGMLTRHKMLFDQVYSTLVESMPLVAITGAIRRWLIPETVTVVVLVNRDSNLSEIDVRQTLKKVAEYPAILDLAVRVDQPKKSQIPKEKISTLSDYEILPGLKLVYKHHPDAQIFSLTAATEGGLRGETDKNAGLFNAIAAMLATATSVDDHESFVNKIEGLGSNMEGFSGKDSLGIQLQCLPEHMPGMVSLFKDAILYPEFPKEQWAAISREILQAIETQEDSPAGFCMRKIQEFIYQQHPYRYAVMGTKESVQGFNESQLKQEFINYRDQGPWVIAAVGPMEANKMVHLLREIFADWRLKPEMRTFPGDRASHIVEKLPRQAIKFTKDREQTHIGFGFKGIPWGDSDRYALDVLTNILGGHSGRLFQSLREKESLAYTVSPILSYGKVMGIIASYIATSSEKAEKALSALKSQVLDLREVAPHKDEVTRAKNYIIGSHEMSLQRGDAQSSSMALMEIYGYGYRDHLNYPEEIRKVTADDVLRVGARLLRMDESVEVMVGK